MADKDPNEGFINFECGCKLETKIIDGEKTAILEACDNPNCLVRVTVEEETKQLCREVIYGRKDITQ
jgi:hypothetical protein